ncbi:MAG: hypothetical protein ABIA59_00160 [Candidatus Latescibacterota bacterium]
MMVKTIFVVWIVLLASAPVVTGESQLPNSDSFDLHVGQQVTVGDNIQIGFDGIATDSRCPEGVFCIWEGDAVTMMWADEPSSDKLAVELHTHRGFQWQFTFGDYRITLLGVAPYPKIDERIDPNDYVATIQVAKVLTPVDPSTWGRIKALYN